MTIEVAAKELNGVDLMSDEALARQEIFLADMTAALFQSADEGASQT